MSAAFIVKGPPTYMNAEEAWFKYWGKRDGGILFVVLPKGNPHYRVERMRAIIDENKWEDIVWIETQSNIDFRDLGGGKFKKVKRGRLARLIAYFRDRQVLDKEARRFAPCRLVFSCPNDLHEHLAAALQPEELYLLDSGVTVTRISPSGYIDYRNSLGSASRIILRTIGYKIVDRSRTHLFSTYGALKTKHQVVANSHAMKKQVIASRPLSDEVFWISTPLADKYGASLEAYIDYIKATLSALSLNPSKLIYIPHPGKESFETLETIRTRLCCRIDQRPLPVEMKFLRYEKIPAVCVSSFSSSLLNIATLAGERVKIWSAWHHEFDRSPTLVSWRAMVEKDYPHCITFLDIRECAPLVNFEAELRS
jgi:hypothetical protein